MADGNKRKKRHIKKLYKRLRQTAKDQINRFVNIVRTSDVVNRAEIRFCGLQRSGNHPVINWLYSQARESKCFLNWVPRDANPFIYFQKRATVDEFQKDFFQKFNVFAEQIGFHSRKNLLIYSFEDENLKNIASDTFERHHDRWLGKSEKRFDALLLRDPFNLFASRQKKENDILENRYSLKDDAERAALISLWKEYAREFLGETNLLPNKRTISYNRWFSDRDYRQRLSASFELEFSDDTMDTVLPIGGGSSFDRTRKDADASSMKVFDRWTHYRDDPFFKAIFTGDPELVELSQRIFGESPAITEWLRS